jgi:hypothetical protein
MSYKLGRRCIFAVCQDCEKEWSSLNAQGVAARHAKAHGHTVSVEVVQYIFYGPDKSLELGKRGGRRKT